jgi:hypothetical protein
VVRRRSGADPGAQRRRIAGRYDLVVIWESGRVLVGERAPAWSRLTPGQHRRLRDALDAADFAHAPDHPHGLNFGYAIDYDRWSVLVSSSDVEGSSWLGAVLAVPQEVTAQHRR